MRARRVELICWAVFAFVAWNVAFDRAVAVAGSDFARQQIVRYAQGEPVQSIDQGFSPQVRSAAWVATAWAGLVLGAGAIVMMAAARRTRPDAS